MKEILDILKYNSEPYTDILAMYENGNLEKVCAPLFDLSFTEDGHKNNFLHTLTVLKNVCDKGFSYEMKIVATFHDIGKTPTKRKIGKDDWTFHNHEAVGANMFVKLCQMYNITDIDIDYIYKMILYHGRVKMHRDVSDSAIRRLSNDVGQDLIFDVIDFSKCDLTTQNKAKFERIDSGYDTIRQRIVDVRKMDEYDAWRSPLTGHVIMNIFNNNIEGKQIGDIKRSYDDILRNEKMTLDDVITEIKILYKL